MKRGDTVRYWTRPRGRDRPVLVFAQVLQLAGGFARVYRLDDCRVPVQVVSVRRLTVEPNGGHE